MENNSKLDINTAATQFIKEKEFWLNNFSDNIEISRFPIDIPNNEGIIRNSCQYYFEGSLYKNFISLCKNNNPNIHAILTALTSFLLSRYTNNKDIIVGTTIDKQDSNVNLINTVLPIKINLDKIQTFKELIINTRTIINSAIEHQNYPIHQMLYGDLKTRINSNELQLFDVAIILENLQDKSYLQDVPYNMLFSFNNVKDKISLTIEFSDKYNKHTIDKIFNSFILILENCLKNLDIEIHQFNILTIAEQEQLKLFNATEKQYPDTETVVQLFEKQVAKNPNKIAVVFKDKSITYSELNNKANQLAHFLMEQGDLKNKPVAILMDRGIEIVYTILAIWKAGGAYLPLDIQYPSGRILEIMDISAANTIISFNCNVDKVIGNKLNGRIVFLDSDKDKIELKSKKKPSLNNETNDLAYVIFTSGSTGIPKGAMIEHKGMVNHIYAKINDLQLDENTIICHNASIIFDISVWQIFTALVLGSRTLILPSEYILDIELFKASLLNYQIAILEVVPSYLDTILPELEAEGMPLRQLLFLLVTGEAVSKKLVERWIKLYPNIKMVNAYGPTEASDDITHFIIDNNFERDIVPIGKPIQNTQIYILNDDMQLCPLGVKGEICVAGVGVGRGYINEEKRSNEVFMANHFSVNTEERLYKTGDLGYWLSDGNIAFLGRKDSQVKIRGFRIELGEIETSLVNNCDILEAVVLDKEYDDNNRYLCAYLKTSQKIDYSIIKQKLSAILPYYMIPDYYFEVDDFPLTPNGKIDRKTLKNMKDETEQYIKHIEKKEISKFIRNINTYKGNDIIQQEIYRSSISEAEKNQILNYFNNTSLDIPKDILIHQMLEKVVEATPDRIALSCCDQSLSFLELQKESSRISKILNGRGVKQGSIVGIYLDRSNEMIIALLGILKAGAAFLPIGKENPIDRINYMLTDCNVDTIITDNSSIFKANRFQLIDINDPEIYSFPDSIPHNILKPSDLAYVMYTSGTTGNPKGVMIEHKTVVNLCAAMDNYLHLNDKQIILSLITISFDMFITESIYPLSKGIKVVIGHNQMQTDTFLINTTLKKEAITCFQCTPTMLKSQLNTTSACDGLKKLENLLVGGEVFTLSLYKQIELQTKAAIYNLYGPTEVTVYASGKKLDSQSTINIGKPLSNMSMYIVDSDFVLCPINEIGELCIGGAGIARGYWNKNELSNEKFIDDPFFKGQRIYKTGDLAKWLPNGEVEFIGRQDNQIKINGIRVELEEIENVLLKFKGVKEAIVLQNKTLLIENKLCAYLVGHKRFVEKELREFLADEIPMYMIPSFFIQLDKIPCIPSGKVDRGLLSMVELNTADNYQAPSNEIEEILAEIWRANLKYEKQIGVKDNYFNIGGDSIKSISVISKINKEFNTSLKLLNLFQNETIEKLAMYLEKSKSSLELKCEEEKQKEEILNQMESMKNEFFNQI